jgi:hypothetical protein
MALGNINKNNFATGIFGDESMTEKTAPTIHP